MQEKTAVSVVNSSHETLAQPKSFIHGWLMNLGVNSTFREKGKKREHIVAK